LFQLVSKRNTKGSIIVTSNKSYSEWGAVFSDEVAAAAIIDRPPPLLDHGQHPRRELSAQRQKRAGVFSMPTSSTGGEFETAAKTKSVLAMASCSL
jgi:hypothetical protein